MKLQKVPLGQILSSAFRYWAGSLGYQFLFSILYFGVILLLGRYFITFFGLTPTLVKMQQEMSGNPTAFMADIKMLAALPAFANFSAVMIAVRALVFPLNIGLYTIYRKMENREEVDIRDLFSGFSGAEFFKYFSLALFTSFVYNFLLAVPPMAAIWVVLTLFCAPLMLFANRPLFQGISLGFSALKIYFIEIFVCSICAVLFCYGGLMFFGFGFLSTFPFWTAIIYSLYRTIFSESAQPL